MDSNKNAIQLKYYVDTVFLFLYIRIALNRNRTLCYDVSLSDTYWRVSHEPLKYDWTTGT